MKRIQMPETSSHEKEKVRETKFRARITFKATKSDLHTAWVSVRHDKKLATWPHVAEGQEIEFLDGWPREE